MNGNQPVATVKTTLSSGLKTQEESMTRFRGIAEMERRSADGCQNEAALVPSPKLIIAKPYSFDVVRVGWICLRHKTRYETRASHLVSRGVEERV